MSTSTERVAEYVRQVKLKRDSTEVIHGVWTDSQAEMAELRLTDLEVILELAEQYEDLADS